MQYWPEFDKFEVGSTLTVETENRDQDKNTDSILESLPLSYLSFSATESHHHREGDTFSMN